MDVFCFPVENYERVYPVCLRPIVYKRKTAESLVVQYSSCKYLASKYEYTICNGYVWSHSIFNILSKLEHNMSELMKAASKEACGKAIREKLFIIGNVFQKCREVSRYCKNNFFTVTQI